MIEMLGVLAIIGVLSIGGLYAYRQAMLRYKAERIVDFINRLQLTSLDAGFSKVKMNTREQFIKFACSAGFLEPHECKLMIGSINYGSVFLEHEWRAYIQKHLLEKMCLSFLFTRFQPSCAYSWLIKNIINWSLLKHDMVKRPHMVIRTASHINKQLENDYRAYETGNFVLQWFLD